jgi:hypothetical protein
MLKEEAAHRFLSRQQLKDMNFMMQDKSIKRGF